MAGVLDIITFPLAAAVATPFVLSFLAPWVVGRLRQTGVWFFATGVALLTLGFGLAFFPVTGNTSFPQSYPWAPSVDVALSFHVDGLSLMFVLLVGGIGTFIVLYAGAYLKGHPRLGYFLGLILAFMGSMLGLVLAGDVLTLFVFWELTSVCSFLLIGFDNERRRSRRSALQALAVTGGGGLLLLVGLLWMSATVGSTELLQLNTQGELLRGSPTYPVILVLVLLGAFTKSAQFPFHFWLPNAMEAPTPVSAYLHSATMVKAGIYLLARLHPALGGTSLWSTLLVTVGGITFLLGAIFALSKTDLKQILAQTTVSSLGLLVMLLGLGSEKALEAAIVYLVAHAVFKGALFMVAGGVDHEVGTRDVTRLGGLRRAMPITATAAGLAALSMGGLPPFAGFLAKEVTYAATLAAGVSGLYVTVLSVVANSCMMAAGFAVGFGPFFGAQKEHESHPHEGPVGLWIGAASLAAVGLGIGLLNHPVSHALLSPAVSAVAAHPIEIELHLWPGLHPPLFVSAVTIGFGALLFWKLDVVRSGLSSGFQRLISFDRLYDQTLDGATSAARALVRFVQSGLLRHYMHAIIVLVACGSVVAATSFGPSFDIPAFESADLHVWGIAALAVFSATVIVFSSSRLQAILSMGVLGLAVALTFLLFGGPDLAFTQLMVETLSVVVLALVLTHLPVDGQDRRRVPRMLSDGVLSLAVGAAITVTLWAITRESLDGSLSDYFGQKSYIEAHGRNIVNVILVDFRAIDTLGEIMVVMSTGVAVLALLRRSRRRVEPVPGETR
ncbi:MAG: putative monovalent cation/H+ antiporter subunit A [Myxococcota bacterium]